MMPCVRCPLLLLPLRPRNEVLVIFTLPFLLLAGLMVWLRSASLSRSPRRLLLLDEAPGLSRAAAPPTIVVVVCGMKTCSKFVEFMVLTGRLPLPFLSLWSIDAPLPACSSSGVTARMVCVPLLLTAVLPWRRPIEGLLLTALLLLAVLGSVCVPLVDMGDMGRLSWLRYSSYMLGSLVCFSLPQRFLLRGLSWSINSEFHTPLRRRDDLSLIVAVSHWQWQLVQLHCHGPTRYDRAAVEMVRTLQQWLSSGDCVACRTRRVLCRGAASSTGSNPIQRPRK